MSIIIWTSPLILSCVHHQSWTYPLMTISSISQTKTNTTSHAKHIINAPYHYTIAWRNLSATRRNGSADRLAVLQHCQASRHTKLLYFWLLLDSSLCTIRSYTNNVTLLVLGTLTQFLTFNNSILKHPGTKFIYFIYSNLQHQSSYASFNYKHTSIPF